MISSFRTLMPKFSNTCKLILILNNNTFRLWLKFAKTVITKTVISNDQITAQLLIQEQVNLVIVKHYLQSDLILLKIACAQHVGTWKNCLSMTWHKKMPTNFLKSLNKINKDLWRTLILVKTSSIILLIACWVFHHIISHMLVWKTPFSSLETTKWYGKRMF